MVNVQDPQSSIARVGALVMGYQKDLVREIGLRFFRNWYLDHRYFRELNSLTLTDLKQRRAFEPELLVLPHVLKRGDVAFDVGANMGIYSYQLARICGAENVLSFEPLPRLARWCRRILPNVQLFEIACSSEEGTSKFRIPMVGDREIVWRSTLEIDRPEEGETDSKIIEVKTQRIDSFFSQRNMSRLDFVKIDVEGHERTTIQGGAEVFRQHHPTLLVEIEQRHHDFPIEQVFEDLRQLGYELRFFQLQSGQFHPIGDFSVAGMQEVDPTGSTYVNNFWAVAPGSDALKKIDAFRAR